MNKFELAVHETRSVLDEWLMDVPDSPTNDLLATAVVDRLIAKGVIQSTIEDDLRDFRGDDYRTGPLEPGSSTVGGSKP
jgi:hypothetical protein